VALLELFVIRRIGKAEFGTIAVDLVKQDAHNPHSADAPRPPHHRPHRPLTEHCLERAR
jgi:hypothetical protein